MAKKIQLQDANGNVLHPLTLGECVTMSNGENLDTLMSKSQMFTPTIAQDKGMFKVGTGIDVDYSANVKDGAYEGLVFKGKSLVNLINYNDSIVSVSSKYVQFSSMIREVIGATVTVFNFGDKEVRMQTSVEGAYSRQLYFTPNTKTLVKLNPNEKLERIRGSQTNGWELNEASLNELKNSTMVIEGDYTNMDVSYFEGLGSCKMPILRNIGKNLLSPSYIQRVYFGVTVGSPIVIHQSSSGAHSSIVKYPCKVGDTYTLTYTSGNADRNIVTELDANDVVLKTSTTRTNTYTVANSNTKKLCWYIGQDVSNPIPSNAIMLEVGEQQTGFEDHKTNILRTSEEVVLREVNGVQDTYNPLTGEYTKRIGEITLNGSENEWVDWNENSFVLRGSYFSDAIEHSSLTAPRLKCNNMVAGLGETPRTVRYYKSPTVLWTMVGKNDGETLDQFKQWLSQNPATIQYILTEPVTTIVKPSTMTPFAYQNGHAIVESGFEGQSLLPEIEYSVVTGRTGQVTQNTKVLRKQEQQIIGLEELLLTQIVQMEYERTLLQFDYELQMMMLG